MPNFKVEIEILIEKICYFGNKIDCRDDVFLQIEIFNKIKFSKQCPARFPVLLCERFCFREIFFNCFTWMSVIDKLVELPVTIELIQCSCNCKETSVAYFDTNVFDLTELCDTGPKRCVHRNIRMINKNVIRSCDSPSLVYSTTASIYKLLTAGRETGFCSKRPTSLTKRKVCRPSVKKPWSPNFSRMGGCFQRDRSLSPSSFPARSIPCVRNRCCPPSALKDNKFLCSDKTQDQKWNFEIAKLTKNLREINDQIRHLTNMQKIRLDPCQPRNDYCRTPQSSRCSTSLPCRRIRDCRSRC